MVVSVLNRIYFIRNHVRLNANTIPVDTQTSCETVCYFIASKTYFCFLLLCALPIWKFAITFLSEVRFRMKIWIKLFTVRQKEATSQWYFFKFWKMRDSFGGPYFYWIFNVRIGDQCIHAFKKWLRKCKSLLVCNQGSSSLP